MAPQSRTANLKPGREGLGHFLELLGNEVDGWALESLLIRGETVEFALVKGGNRASFELTRPSRNRPSATTTNTLAVHTRGSRDWPKPHEQALARSIVARLSGTSFVELFRRLRSDALLYSDPSHSEVPSRLDRHHRVLDHGADFWKFFYPNARFLEQEVRLQGKVVRISHGTAECRFNNPQLPIRSLRYFTDERVARAPDDAEFIDTSLTEGDVLSGRTMASLTRAMDDAISRGPSVVHLMTTCLPELIGDDPRSLLRKAEKDPKVTVCWSSKTRDSGASYDAVVSRMLQRVEFAPERDPTSVLLAGVPNADSAKEARELLAGLGLTVVAELFPALDLLGAQGAANAGAVVWLNPVGWEKIGNDHFLSNGLAVVRYHPPFGEAATRAWLQRICQVLKRDPLPIERMAAKDGASLDSVRKRAGRYRIALVGDRRDLDILVTHGRTLGMSVAALLCEMGFHVACFVYCPEGAEQPTIAPAPTASGTLEFLPFRTSQELDTLLSSQVDAALTHYAHDPRLACYAIPGFCEDLFEVGFRGMVRSAERLLHLCESRPFAEQRSWLAAGAPHAR